MGSSDNPWKFGLAEVLLAGVLGVVSAFAIASIPWAMRVSSDLATITTRLDAHDDFRHQIDKLEERVRELEKQ